MMCRSQSFHTYGRLCLVLLLPLLVPTSNAFYTERITPKQYGTNPSAFEEEPVVLEQVLETEECDTWLKHMLESNTKEPVLVQKKCGNDMMLAKMPLEEGVKEVVEKSSHWDPIRLSSLGPKLTQDIPLAKVLSRLYCKTKAENDDLKKKDRDTLDWFEYLKEHVPIMDTLLVSGTGAASPTVMCHPYTKYHLCIDGSQLIRLLPPLPYRNNPTLVAEAMPIIQATHGGFPMSLGCQSKLGSNLNLFAHRHRDVDHGIQTTIPQMRHQHQYHSSSSSGTKNSRTRSTTQNNVYDQYQHWAEDPSMLHPNFYLPVEHHRGKERANKQPKLHHDLFHSSLLVAGDMMIIPPGWWYQTYNVEPSVALQTQRLMKSSTATQFIDHVLQAAGLDFHFDDEGKTTHTPKEAQNIVDTLFELLQEHYDMQDANGNVIKKRFQNIKSRGRFYNGEEEDEDDGGGPGGHWDSPPPPGPGGMGPPPFFGGGGGGPPPPFGGPPGMGPPPPPHSGGPGGGGWPNYGGGGGGPGGPPFPPPPPHLPMTP